MNAELAKLYGSAATPEGQLDLTKISAADFMKLLETEEPGEPTKTASEGLPEELTKVASEDELVYADWLGRSLAHEIATAEESAVMAKTASFQAGRLRAAIQSRVAPQ